MALLDRVLGLEQPAISQHTWWAAMVMLAYGEVTIAQVKTQMAMSADEQGQFDTIVAMYQASTNKEKFLRICHAATFLGRQGYNGYNSHQDIVDILTRAG